MVDEQEGVWFLMSYDLKIKFCKLIAHKSAQLFMKEYTKRAVWPQWPVGYSKGEIFKCCVKQIDYEELLRILKFFLQSDFASENLAFIFDASFLYSRVTESHSTLTFIKTYCNQKYNLDFDTIPNCRENDIMSDGYHSD